MNCVQIKICLECNKTFQGEWCPACCSTEWQPAPTHPGIKEVNKMSKSEEIQKYEIEIANQVREQKSELLNQAVEQQIDTDNKLYWLKSQMDNQIEKARLEINTSFEELKKRIMQINIKTQ